MRLAKSAPALIVLALLAISQPPVTAGAEVIITVADYSFEPRNAVVGAGETVTWIWSDGFHTTTNGNGIDDPNGGLLWDSFLFPGQKSFSYVFTTPGVYPFFCRFHEALDMKGSVKVLRIRFASNREKAAGPEPLEPASWGAIKSLYR